MCLLFLLFFANPLKRFYYKERIGLIKALEQCFISPLGIGKIQFRHFFLADVITSMHSLLKEFATFFTFMYARDQPWRFSTAPAKLQETVIIAIVIGFVPDLIRFSQCVKKYFVLHSQGNPAAPMQAKNAGKYFSALVAEAAHLWAHGDARDTAFWVWLFFKTFSTIYKYIWDLRVDWGLLRFWKISDFGLREKQYYPKFFYYWAIFTNFVLRFSFFYWTFVPISLMQEDVDLWSVLKLKLGISLVLEAYRRTQWSLLRVENENINNFEGYRQILKIPPLIGSQ